MMLNKVRELMAQQGLDGLWVTDEKSLDFLYNLNLSCGERFVGLYIDFENKPQLVLNKLFTIDNDEVEVVYYYDHEPVKELISEVTSGLLIGLDKNMRAEFVLDLIDRNPSKHFEIGSDCVDQLRAIKSDEQIQKMINASKINDLVMTQIRDELKVNMSEIEVRDRIIELFKEQNVIPSFDIIVAFGDHGTDPHAIPSDRRLKENESIIIDMGCLLDGFCSDMTRTYYLNGKPHEDIYDLVLSANTEAIKSIRPGMTFSELDGVARKIISDGGYGEYFTHRLGHGIGQEVHEPYDVSSSNHKPILPGMCFSIEPGIYKPGVNAVRIEDLVYIDQDGYGVLLNHVDKENPVLKV